MSAANSGDSAGKALYAVSEILDRLRRQSDNLRRDAVDSRTQLALMKQQLDALEVTMGNLKRLVQDGNGQLPLATRTYILEETAKKNAEAINSLLRRLEADSERTKDHTNKIRIALIAAVSALGVAAIESLASLVAG